MYDQMALHAIASDRMAEAQHAADLHRQRVTLRRDPRSVLATRLQRLAMRLDARAGSTDALPAHRRHPIATDRELCRAA